MARLTISGWFIAWVVGLASLHLQTTASAQPPQVLTRVFFQDDATQTIKWADLLAGEKPVMGPVREIQGFPKLDPERQRIVGLQQSGGLLLALVRDNDHGQFQSGWVLVECGVYQEAHGDHSHWLYPVAPRIRAVQLDGQQGNPARLYEYDGAFHWTVESQGGFMRLDPASIGPNDSPATVTKRIAFHRGGSGAMTLSSVGKVVAFSTWDDAEGAHAGRVDVTAIKPVGNDKPTFSFQLPVAGARESTANHGKVFFATAEGLTWVAIPPRIASTTTTLPATNIAIEEAADSPTASRFLNYGHFVTFTAGAGERAALCYLDASAVSPRVLRLPLKMAEGEVPGEHVVIRNRRGQPVAFVFHESAAEAVTTGNLAFVELDPDRNGDWSDAKLALTLNVGGSGSAESGRRRSLSVESDNRRAVYSNPGDGTLMVLSIDERRTVTGFKVGGAPTRVVTVGGRVSNH